MSKEILQDIIDDFSPEKFIRFFRQKNHSFTPLQESIDYYNDEDFSDGKKLGEIAFTPGEKLTVCSFKVNKDLTERSGKKAQYEKGRKILKEIQADAGIFVFYDSEGNFRFSLIYQIPKGTKRDWNNFKRFTYFINPLSTYKTFIQRIGDGDFSTLEKIKDAFSLEPVTKQFYEELQNWYFWAMDEIEFPDDEDKDRENRNAK
ncbi:MAG: class I SAM-dependent DNA methyltransferase, partial [Candidatus Aerophobetes bacterium]|nr:class I SAM-dependent DNA methyltransferase [Candidatus Aerophobetes bacterium]